MNPPKMVAADTPDRGRMWYLVDDNLDAHLRSEALPRLESGDQARSSHHQGLLLPAPVFETAPPDLGEQGEELTHHS